MKSANILANINYKAEKISVETLLETDFSKEIRISMLKGQQMKQHQAPFPIVIEVFEGNIRFGVEHREYELQKGDLLTLEAGVPHHLEALTDSIVRLTIAKADHASRVEQVAQQSAKNGLPTCDCGS